MRITQVVYSGFGGAGSVTFSIISGGRTENIDWSIGFVGDVNLDLNYVRRCRDFCIDFCEIKKSSKSPFLSWWKLFFWLYSNEPEVVICHSSTFILPCAIYSIYSRAPLISVEHTSNQVKTKLEKIASLLSMRLSNRVVVLTQDYSSELVRMLGPFYNSAKVLQIPNGVDSRLFSPNKSEPIIKKVVRLGMASRFSTSKRHDLLVDALIRLRMLRSEIVFFLHFAGDGTELNHIRSLSIKNELNDYIYFDGLLSEEQLAEWMRGLDIYVHASDAETQSTSILQAMSTGLPIVASDVRGITNLLGCDGLYGLCATNNPNSFAESILKIVDSKELSEKLGCNARQKVLDFYDDTRMFRLYYKSIVECLAL